MTTRLSKAALAFAIFGGALIAATPALTQARWGHADQPMPKSYSGWSDEAYAAAPMYVHPSYGYRSYAYQPNYGYGVRQAPRLVSPYESYGSTQDYGRTFDSFDAPNAFGHN